MIKDSATSSNGMRSVVMKYLATGDKALESRLTSMEKAWCARQKTQTIQVARRASRFSLAKKDEPKKDESKEVPNEG